MIALVDCNNFYASCERVFNPALIGKPVVVLSSNDGCIIARSNEAKAIGIKMGEPLFKCAPLIKLHNVHVFSSNFTLYGDMSSRVMQTLESFTESMEIYSIDEAFIKLGGHAPDTLADYGQAIGARVRQWTGLPISIGIAPTKTLAKIANKIAKTDPRHNGVFIIHTDSDYRTLLEQTPVNDIWGIGRRITVSLCKYGITNALQLINQPDEWIRKKLTIMGLRTVWELRGISCIHLHEQPDPKQSIACTRSFGNTVSSKESLQEAVSLYVCRAAAKVRAQGSAVCAMQIFITTSRFNREDYYYNSTTIELATPTDYTPTLIAHARKAVSNLFREGYRYKKAGVIMLQLVDKDQLQTHMFDTVHRNQQQDELMQAIDTINGKWGRDTVHSLATGLKRQWTARCSLRSARFTTSWDELLKIKN